MIRLWTINRLLRWVGIRLCVRVDHYARAEYPTMIGFVWDGLPGTRRWRSAEAERTPASGGSFAPEHAQHSLPPGINPIAEVDS